MDFRINELVNETLDRHMDTWSHTLDVSDFVPKKYLKKIDKYIYKLLKSKFKETEVYDLLYLQELGKKLGVFEKLKIWLSGLKPLYESEKKLLLEQKENTIDDH